MIGLHRPRPTLVLSALVAAAAILVGAFAPNRLTTAGFIDPDSPSAVTLDRLRESLGYDPEPGMIVLARSPSGFDDSDDREQLTHLAARLRADPAVGHVESGFGANAPAGLMSSSGTATLLLVHFRESDPNELSDPVDRLRSELHAPGLEVSAGGPAVATLDANRIARDDLIRAELIAFPLLLLLLVALFRRPLAALIPLVIGAVSVATTFAVLRLLSGTLELSVFAFNLAVLLGLGLAVDYSLLLVARYREELAAAEDRAAAIRATVATAGRTVAFSGFAVAGACSALLVFPQSVVYSMGVGGIIVSLLAAASALIITPALLVVAGSRVEARPRDHRGAGWSSRWAMWIDSHHIEGALIGACLLVAAAAPALLLKPAMADLTTVPTGYESRTVADAVASDFLPNIAYPVNVGIEVPAGANTDQVKADLLGAIATTPGVAGFNPLQGPDSDVAVIQLILRDPPGAESSQRAVSVLRALPPDFLVGGRAAEFSDLNDSIAAHAPLAIGIAASASILVLFALTGSLVIPLKALALNAAGLAATFGLLVLIFQDGALDLDGLLGYDGPPGIEAAMTVVIAALTLGLATDYSILLLSRIAEGHSRGDTDAEAVRTGIVRTGPVITSAALVLAVALLGLATSRIFIVKELTVGVTVGVLIDVTVIRMLMVPSLMRILGRANWWAPGPLRRMRDRASAYAIRPIARRNRR